MAKKKPKKRKKEMSEFEKQTLLFNWVSLLIGTLIGLIGLYIQYKGLI